MMKVVMKNYYVHKSNRDELIDMCPEREHVKRILYGLDGFLDYEVIKYDSYNHKLSLIQSPDWDIAKEPIVGDAYVFDLTIGRDLSDTPYKVIKGRKKNPQIYHNKWQFVSNDYTGFDIEEAKQRTKEWNSIPNLDKSRIGNRDFWVELLKVNGMEI